MGLVEKYLEPITYSNPMGEIMLQDSSHNYTGEKIATYSAPSTVQAFVSADASRGYLDEFGMAEPYDKTAMINDRNCPVEEGALVWIGTSHSLTPISGTDPVAYKTGKYQYLVKKVLKAKCLSYTGIVMSKEDTSA